LTHSLTAPILSHDDVSLQNLLAEQDLLADDPEAALARLAPVRERAEREGAVDFSPTLAMTYIRLGREAEAEVGIEAELQRAQSRQDRLAPVAWLWARGLLRAQQDRWDGAQADLDAALAIARAVSHPRGEGRLLHSYGSLCLARGEAGRALWFPEDGPCRKRAGRPACTYRAMILWLLLGPGVLVVVDYSRSGAQAFPTIPGERIAP
jgi:hypothetical protein